LFLLIRWAQRARCQAETPLIVLCRFPQPALFELAPIPHTEKTGLTEAEITERIKELAAKHGMDAAKLLGGNVALPPKA
jgi:hypothetical protein